MDIDISNVAISTSTGRSNRFFDYTKEVSDYLIRLNLPLYFAAQSVAGKGQIYFINKFLVDKEQSA